MRKHHDSLWFLVIALLFVSLAVTAFIITLCILIALRLNVISFTLPFRALTMLGFVLTCVLLGTVIVSFAGKNYVSPIGRLISATKKVSRGDFSVQVENDRRNPFNELTQEFNRMVRELGSIETLRNDFVANVSHEFKTPIAAIEGCAALLESADLTEDERREYAHLISESSHRLSVLTSNILQLSKLENQEIVPEQSEFQLDEQIRQAILMLEPQWSAKNIQLDIDLPDTSYFCSEELLMQVWLNVIGNAIKFTGDGGTVSVRLTKDEKDKKLFVSVRDSGVGMDRDTVEHIFDKFYQGDKSHSGMGNGLGLPLANRILTLFGGNIYVRSEKGVGSEFVIELDDSAKEK